VPATGARQQVEKETGAAASTRSTKRRAGDGELDIKLDQGCKPLVMTHGALRAPTIGYVLTSLLTT
jgi:hypothetical protein